MGFLAARLETNFRVWWDRDLVVGQDFFPALFDATTIVVLSKDSIQGEWVAREIDRAPAVRLTAANEQKRT